eukprot:5616110-Amphidinium_carterae.1
MQLAEATQRCTRLGEVTTLELWFGWAKVRAGRVGAAALGGMSIATEAASVAATRRRLVAEPACAWCTLLSRASLGLSDASSAGYSSLVATAACMNSSLVWTAPGPTVGYSSNSTFAHSPGPSSTSVGSWKPHCTSIARSSIDSRCKPRQQ